MRDLISVIIPTYGRTDYLIRAVNSVLMQSHSLVEIIVVDDNDPDSPYRRDSALIVSNLMRQDTRISYIKHPKNRNGSAARNTGLRVARGEFVAFLDDDDELLPDKLKKQVDLLRANPLYQASYCLNSSFFKGKVVKSTTFMKSGNCAYEIFTMRAEIHTSSLLVYREAVNSIGGFDESFIRHQEYEFMVRFFEKYSMVCLPEILLRVHIDSSLNRPNVNRLIAAKSHYFTKLESFIVKYPIEDQYEIYKSHNFQIFRTCVKNYDLRAFKYLYLAKPNFKDFFVHLGPYILKYYKIFGVRIARK